MKQRHFPFFPEHWKGEAALRMCSSAARGLWIDMMCEMHSGQPYGHLTTATGVPIVTIEQIARIVGERDVDVRRWLTELEQVQVFSRTDDGTIYSRRMVRDEKGRGEWRDRQNRVRQPRDTGVTEPAPSRESHADVTHMSRESHADVTHTSRESHASKGKGKGKKDTAPSATPQVSPAEKISSQPEPCTCLTDPIPVTEFESVDETVTAFMASFSGAKKSAAVAKLRPLWVAVLEAMRRDNFAWGAIWRAFCKAHGDGNHGPLNSAEQQRAVWFALRATRPTNGRQIARVDELVTIPLEDRK